MPWSPLYIGVMINFSASALIYTATLQGFPNSWLQKVDGVDAALALDREVYVAALYFATVGTRSTGRCRAKSEASSTSIL